MFIGSQFRLRATFCASCIREALVERSDGSRQTRTETEQEQVVRALNAGANEYVMKPFTKDILVAKLNMLDLFEE